MINRDNGGIVKGDKVLFLVLALELMVVICLTIVLLIVHHSDTPGDDDYVSATTIEHKSCSSDNYKAFDDRVFYYPNSKNVDESLLAMLSDRLVTNYPDSDIKVLITSTPVLSDDMKVIRGYQVMNGVVLENTFFTIDVRGSDFLDEFPSLVNSDSVKTDGLMEESKVEDIAYSAIETEIEHSNTEIINDCSYGLYFTDSSNGVINKPTSNFYYKFIFNLKEKGISSPKGFVFVDGKNGEVLESYIDSGIKSLE